MKYILRCKLVVWYC